MKKYKLKKDTLSTKAGAIFTRIDGSLGDIMVGPLGAGGDISIEVDDIINFDEWFEEVKRFEEWKPKMGDSFKTLSSCGDIYCSIWNGGSDHEYCLSIGNCYPLDTPNKVIIKEQELIPRAMHRLRMAAKKAWFEFDGSEGPDWNDSQQKKFSIKRWHVTGAYLANYASNEQYLGGVYFPTSDSAHYYINNNEDDIELLFGVE